MSKASIHLNKETCWCSLISSEMLKRSLQASVTVLSLSKLDLFTQINHQVLVYLSFSLEAGRKQELPAVNWYQRKRSRCLNIELLRWDELAPLGVPLVDLCQWVVTAQDGVLPVSNGDRLEHHGSAGRKCLDLLEHGTVPTHDLGVPDESCQAYKKLTFEKKDSWGL